MHANGGCYERNEYKPEGAVFKMEWSTKPGCFTWLKEEEVVRYYPEESRRFLRQLKSDKSRKLNGIIRRAGPMTTFL